MALISITNLNLTYGNKPVAVDFNLQVEKGDKVVIKGHSGKGKSSLLNVLMGFERTYSSGSVYFEDVLLDKNTINHFRSKIAWVPQETAFLKGPVQEIIMLPFTFKNNKELQPTKAEILTLFDLLGLGHEILDKKSDAISGGEKQRVALVTALLLKKEILILDEPTSALDEQTKGSVADFILGDKNRTVISASHDALWIAKCNKVKEL